MPPQQIAQPTVQEVEQYARLQAQQQQAAIQMQLSAEMRAVAHELFIDMVKRTIHDDGVESITQDKLRRMAMYATRFSPYVLEAELPQLVKVNPWPAEEKTKPAK